MLTGLEATTQYILKMIRCLCKTDCSSVRAEVEKNCPGLILVGLKQSEETLKLLVNFQMMRKCSFIAD